MPEFRDNMGSIADDLLKAKSFFKEKFFENFGVKEMMNKVIASNLTVAFFTHLKSEESEEKCVNDVNVIFNKFLETIKNDECKDKTELSSM